VMTECIQSGFGFEACGSRQILAQFDGGTPAEIILEVEIG